jgi:hypothetical protein
MFYEECVLLPIVALSWLSDYLSTDGCCHVGNEKVKQTHPWLSFHSVNNQWVPFLPHTSLTGLPEVCILSIFRSRE